MSRIARGLSKTFSYHNYDPTSVNKISFKFSLEIAILCRQKRK